MEKVCVLMSTYNGEKFLKEQLDSLVAQEGVDISILVRDDGSKDGTKEILDDWQEKGLLTWYTGENLKSARSFMHMVSVAPDADYYAFCDQDDVWETNKIVSAISLMKEKECDLYYSSYTTVDSELNVLSKDVQKPIMNTLGTAFVYASVTGCTMVFSHNLLVKAKKYEPHHLMMHDSWLYKIALATGGRVVYDSHSHILYRQHENNVIGDHHSKLILWKNRLGRIIHGDRKRYGEVKDLYDGYKDIMGEKELNTILPLIGYYDKSLFKRISIAFSSKYKTGVLSKDILFKIAVIFKLF